MVDVVGGGAGLAAEHDGGRASTPSSATLSKPWTGASGTGAPALSLEPVELRGRLRADGAVSRLASPGSPVTALTSRRTVVRAARSSYAWSRSVSLHLCRLGARVVPGARLGVRRQGGRGRRPGRGRRARLESAARAAVSFRRLRGRGRRRSPRARPSSRTRSGRRRSAHLQPRIPERRPRSVRPDGRSHRRQRFSVRREGRQLHRQREDAAVRRRTTRATCPPRSRCPPASCRASRPRRVAPLRTRLAPDLPDEDRPARVSTARWTPTPRRR